MTCLFLLLSCYQLWFDGLFCFLLKEILVTQILDLFNFKHYINSTYQGVEEWDFVVLRMSSGCDLLDPDRVVLKVEEEGG